MTVRLAARLSRSRVGRYSPSSSPPGAILFLYLENVGAFPASQQDRNGGRTAQCYFLGNVRFAPIAVAPKLSLAKINAQCTHTDLVPDRSLGLKHRRPHNTDFVADFIVPIVHSLIKTKKRTQPAKNDLR